MSYSRFLLYFRLYLRTGGPTCPETGHTQPKPADGLTRTMPPDAASTHAHRPSHLVLTYTTYIHAVLRNYVLGVAGSACSHLRTIVPID